MFRSMKMRQKSKFQSCPISIFWLVDSLASLLVSLDTGEDLKIPEAHSFLKSLELHNPNDHAIYSLKTSKAYYLTTRGKLSEKSSAPLMSWVMTHNHLLLTLKTSYHRTGSVSSLSELLEENPEEKYFLSQNSIKRDCTLKSL